MTKKQGVVAAIGAALTAYLEAEESARLAPLPDSRFSLPAPNTWALFGRDEIMKANALWQLRVINRQPNR